MGEISVKTGNNARNGGKNSLNRLIRCVCGKKIGPDPRNFNQRVSLGRNDLLIRTFLRGFYDLHKSINNKTHIQLIQSRVIDNLLLISIRTEIVIREIFGSISNEPSPDDLRTIFLGLPKFIQDDISASVFNRISDNANWKLTKLNERSEDIFSKLSSCNTGKNWSNEQKYFFEQIFKFITSRNYFAHHYYKDEELNDQVNSLARDVLVSCLNSLLYISALATQVIAWRKK
ncbi:hypothetical protein [Klebsiella pneumoniae]|uniref:hypothetical protein n=1 Tax=Klebsiella pneumoniae TaxID=573 RepID=UPI001918C993|nr:hypothetical protein [Klebsiella pneumoniae]